MKPLLPSLLLAGALGGCAGPGQLAPGRSSLADVEREMGPPAVSWRVADGSMRLAYPRGPAGFQTWMVLVDPAGNFVRADNVLDENHFAGIRPGMTQDQVIQVLGPPQPAWTAYFAARDELAWEWRYCDLWNAAARFDVLFDGTSKTVRSTLSIREVCFDSNCFCTR